MKWEDVLKIPGYIDLYDHTGRQAFYAEGHFGQRINAVCIDEGINDHQDFEDRLITKKCFAGSTTSDYSGHGTAMTGILSGKEGMLPLSKIHHLRVQNDNGDTFLTPIHDALMWLANDYRDTETGEPVDVVSLSISSSQNYAEIKEAVDACEKKDILVVCSVGNKGVNDITFPACFSETVGVSAVNSLLNIEKYSSFGNMVSFAMHGTRIVAPSHKGYNEYDTFTGTSPATPLIAGIAGLLRDKYKFVHGKRMSNEETRMMLRMLSRDLGPVGKDKWYGDGFPALDPSAPKEWSVEIPIDQGYLLDGGVYVSLDQPAFIDPDTNRTVLPVRAVAEALDKEVTWDGEKRIVGLRSKRITPQDVQPK